MHGDLATRSHLAMDFYIDKAVLAPDALASASVLPIGGCDAPARVRSRRISFVNIANTPPSTPVIRTTASAIRRDLVGAVFDSRRTDSGCIIYGCTDTATVDIVHVLATASQTPSSTRGGQILPRRAQRQRHAVPA